MVAGASDKGHGWGDAGGFHGRMHDRMNRRQSMPCRITRGSIPEMDLKDTKKHRAQSGGQKYLSQGKRRTCGQKNRVPSRPGHSGNRHPLWVWGLQEAVGTH
jgi:hypothetical protein